VIISKNTSLQTSFVQRGNLLIFFSTMLSVIFLTILIPTSHAQITPQQLEVLQDKDSALAEVIASSQQNNYESFDRDFHARVMTAVQKLPMKDQFSLRANEATLPTAIKVVKDQAADNSADQQKALNMLWQAAVYRSQPIRYAIEKLSHKDASGKPSKNKTRAKKAVNTLAQVGGAAASMVAGNPLGLISGAFLSDIVRQSETSYSKPVTDADMVILARAIDTLQQDLLDLYLDYSAAQTRIALTAEKLSLLETEYAQAVKEVNTTPESQQTHMMLRFIVDNAKQDNQRAQQHLDEQRHLLGLKVGAEALTLIDKKS